MPLNVDLKLPKDELAPTYMTLDNFKRGVITLIDKSRLPKNALDEADNIFLYEDGMPGPRPGVDWFGTAPERTLSTTITNLCENPSFENNTTGWAGYQATVARTSSTAYVGTYSLAVTVTAITPDSPVGEYSATGLVNGQTYVFAARVKAPVGTTIFAFSSAINNTFSQVTATGGWDLINSNPNPITGTTATIQFGIQGGSVNDVFYIDTVILAQNPAAVEYFDGDTIDTNLIEYAWTGTAGSSTSTKSIFTGDPIDGFDYFDYDGAIHLVAVAGGTVYRSTDDGVTWDACTGATLTADVAVNMNQNGTFLYLTNGVDNIVRYDGTTVLQTYTALTTPAAPTVVETGSGLTSGTAYQYYYKCARVNQVGFSAASTVIQTGLPRESWSAGTNYATLTLPVLSGTQTRYDVYISTDDVDYFYLGSTATTTFVDDGTAVVVPGTQAPTDNTTQGPLVEELTNVGSRQYGVRDTNNRYRIWFTGSGQFSGAFSTAYDGGYLDWQEGGKFIPVKVEDYRDGKGTPLATVWCRSADGQGCILQISLDTLTIDDISITVPSAYKLPGSRGTPAPGSVVNVLNDYMFYNSQAFYNLGSRAQFLNLLSTDEASANIRPTIRQITTAGESQIASAYFDAKVYFSVPYGSSTNNFTAVYDTEQKAWLPTAFTLGFKKFLRYTDTSGTRRLLAVKPGDNRLSEIGVDIQGDYGDAFTTSLATGLYPTLKNRFEFQWVEEGEIELSNPQGTISVELSGIERAQGFRATNSETITSSTTQTGWDSFLWDTTLWDDTSDVVDPFSESSVKRYFTVQKELNAVQWRITTNTIDARYVLRTLQSWGTATNSGKPRNWRLT